MQEKVKKKTYYVGLHADQAIQDELVELVILVQEMSNDFTHLDW